MKACFFLSWLSVWLWANTAQFKTPLTYEVPENVEIYSIRDIDFGPNGNLYALNAAECQIYVWGADGKFLFQFGQKGFGPGELNRCGRIFIGRDSINVFTYQRRIYRFDLQGHYIKTFDVTSAPFDIQSFGFTQADHLIMGGRSYLPETRSSVIRFALFDEKGTFLKTLHEYSDAGVLQIKGEIGFDADIIAYAPQTDIQVTKQGQLLLGYGSQPYLLSVQDTGELGEKWVFPLVTGPPSDRERELFSNLEIALPNGQYVGLNDFPDIQVHWDKDKAYFYNFTPLDNQE
ncbi:MAG: 6-bladed beta-propeller, partial [Acidobacteria bacterium]|nr:6-bladed beta-propeller [Acidobacteriota bacterium]